MGPKITLGGFQLGFFRATYLCQGVGLKKVKTGHDTKYEYDYKLHSPIRAAQVKTPLTNPSYHQSCPQ